MIERNQRKVTNVFQAFRNEAEKHNTDDIRKLQECLQKGEFDSMLTREEKAQAAAGVNSVLIARGIPVLGASRINTNL